MENLWTDLPYLALRMIINMLPIADVVNLAKVCRNWKEIAKVSLKSVQIDESTPYTDSWKNLNKIGLEGVRADQSTIASQVEGFAISLAELTDEIEELSFCGSCIPARALEVLLSSQKTIKILQVEVKPQGYFHPDPNIAAAVAEGLSRHEKSLVKIRIHGIPFGQPPRDRTNYCISYENLVQMLGNGTKYFPNLKSVEFYSNSKESQTAEIFFKRIFEGNKILNLNIKASLIMKKILDNGHLREMNCIRSPFPGYSFMKHVISGRFSNLNWINICYLDTTSRFSPDDADLVIAHCPNITHIGSGHDTSSFIPRPSRVWCCSLALEKLVKHYGSQLIHLHCIMDPKIAENIISHCCNLEHLGIIDDFDSCFSRLERLKELEMGYCTLGMPTELAKCEGLTKLKIRGVKDCRILHVIGKNAKNMQSLEISIMPYGYEQLYSLLDGLMQFLEVCNCLKEMYFEVENKSLDKYGMTYTRLINWNGDDEIIKSLLKHQSSLQKLHLGINDLIDDANKAILVERMPFCKITF